MKSPKTHPSSGIDDLLLKTKRPNHLASPLEKQAAAGFSLPNTLLEKINHRQQLNKSVQSLLIPLLGEKVASSCQIADINATKITLALPSFTAVNHLRRLKQSCLTALQASTDFYQITDMEVILSVSPYRKTTPHPTKKPLDKTANANIAQYANNVISNERLRKAVLNLIDNSEDDIKNSS